MNPNTDLLKAWNGKHTQLKCTLNIEQFSKVSIKYITS